MSSSPLGPRPAAGPLSPISPRTAALTVESFLYLLHSNSGRPLFFEHLRSGFSEHHLLFWEQVQQYKRISVAATSPSSSPPLTSLDEGPLPTALQKAQSINSRFIVTGSPLQINITEQARLRIQHTLAKFIPNGTLAGQAGAAPPPAGLFDESEAVCVELMKGNYFYSFKETSDYQHWLQAERKGQKKAAKGGTKGGARMRCVIL